MPEKLSNCFWKNKIQYLPLNGFIYFPQFKLRMQNLKDKTLNHKNIAALKIS